MKHRTITLAIGYLILLAGCSASAPAATSVVNEPVVATEPPAIVAEATQPPPATEAAISQPDQPPALCEVTPDDTEGPYYLAGAPLTDNMAPANLPGDRLILSGTVYVGDCQTPLAGAVVDLWQADAAGVYDFSESFILRGKAMTDAQGHYQMETIVPGYYEPRPKHIHYKVIADGRPTFTGQIYFVGDDRAAGFPATVLTTLTPQDGVLTAVFNIVLSR